MQLLVYSKKYELIFVLYAVKEAAEPAAAADEIGKRTMDEEEEGINNGKKNNGGGGTFSTNESSFRLVHRGSGA